MPCDGGNSHCAEAGSDLCIVVRDFAAGGNREATGPAFADIEIDWSPGGIYGDGHGPGTSAVDCDIAVHTGDAGTPATENSP